MTHLHIKSHQKICDKAIENIALSGDFRTRIINGKRHISATEISIIFDLSPASLRGLLDEFALQSGQGDTVFITGVERWADATAFYSLTSSYPDAFAEPMAQAVLLALGFFTNCRHLQPCGTAPMDCELVVCQCVAEQ